MISQQLELMTINRQSMRLGFELGPMYWTLQALDYLKNYKVNKPDVNTVTELLISRFQNSLSKQTYLSIFQSANKLCDSPLLQAEFSEIILQIDYDKSSVLKDTSMMVKVLDLISSLLENKWSLKTKAHFDLGIWVFGFIEIYYCIWDVIFGTSLFAKKNNMTVPPYFPSDPTPLLLKAGCDNEIIVTLIQAIEPVHAQTGLNDENNLELSRARHYVYNWYEWYSQKMDAAAINQTTTNSSHSNQPLPKKIKILFLAANPLDNTRLRVDEESRSIDQALQLAEFRDLFEIQQQWAVRVTDLQNYILRFKPDIIHISGHGSEAGEIILENKTSGGGQAVSPKSLGHLFSVLKDNIKCVVLNACYSDKQAKAISRHIDFVIGIPNTISDEAAICFAAAFYQALGFGKDVKTAFDLGCIQIEIENYKDKPKLLATKCNPSDVKFM